MNKKAAIGSTMTWIVATIIILIAVFVFVYSSYILAEKRNFLDFEGIFQEEEDSNADAQQTLFALLNTEINNKKIKDYILENKYSEIKTDIDLILGKIADSLKESYAEVYIREKKVSLDSGELKIK